MPGNPLAAPHTLAELHGLASTARTEYWTEFRRWLVDSFIPTHAFEWPHATLSTNRLRTYSWPECALQHPELVDRLLLTYAWDTNLRRGQPKTGREESRLLMGTLVQQIAGHVQRIGLRCDGGHKDPLSVRPQREEASPAPPPLPHEREPAREPARPSRAGHWWSGVVE